MTGPLFQDSLFTFTAFSPFFDFFFRQPSINLDDQDKTPPAVLRSTWTAFGCPHVRVEYSLIAMSYLLSSELEACSQIVVNENGRFPASSKYSQDPVIVHREEMYLVSVVGPFRLNRIGKSSGLVWNDHANIDGYWDRVGDGRFAGSNLPLNLEILWWIRRHLGRAAAGEQNEAADGD
jgi:hypothetical protein